MLTGIEFKNYKAFNEGRLDIKPINILLGANSVGKSSLIQMFLLLQETALAEHYKSALKLYGGFFSLGEGINLFRNKNQHNTLGLSIEFKDSVLKRYFKDLSDRYSEEVLNYCYFFLTQLIPNESNSDKKFIADHFKLHRGSNKYINDLSFLRSDRKSDISRDSFIEIVNKVSEKANKIDKKILKEISSTLFFSAKNSETVINSISKDKEDIFLTYDFLNKFSEFKESDLIKINYDFSYVDGILKIKNFKLTIGDIEEIFIDFEKVKDPRAFITCEKFPLSNHNFRSLENLREAFDNSRTVFSFVKKDEYLQTQKSTFNISFVRIIKLLVDKASESFQSQNINYVSPLRAYPKRYYFLDKAKTNIFLDTLDGEAIAEILKDNSKLKDNVNTWFRKFNLQIDVGQLKDIIHSIVVKQNSLDLDITDVGFGVSQVLPVIIQGFLSKEKSITLIEQPEIHLHPKMQADLADLFIDIVIKNKKSNSKYLVIETHSEYLLKRLRRRISEGIINSDDVGLYYIESQDNGEGAVIRRIEISDKGGFDWPKDFYSGDLAADVTEFLRNQF